MQGDIYRVDIRGRYQGQNMVVTFAYRTVNTPEQNIIVPGDITLPGWSDDTEITLLLTAIEGYWVSYLPICSVDSLTWNLLRVSRFTPDVERRQTASKEVSWDGSQASEGLPSGVSAVVLRRARNTGSRRYRGHISLPGIRLDAVASGLINMASATWTNLTGFATALQRPLNANLPGWGTIYWAPVIGGFRKLPPTGQPILWRALTESRARQNLGTQRSRIEGHGRTG